MGDNKKIAYDGILKSERKREGPDTAAILDSIVVADTAANENGSGEMSSEGESVVVSKEGAKEEGGVEAGEEEVMDLRKPTIKVEDAARESPLPPPSAGNLAVNNLKTVHLLENLGNQGNMRGVADFNILTTWTPDDIRIVPPKEQETPADSTSSSPTPLLEPANKHLVLLGMDETHIEFSMAAPPCPMCLTGNCPGFQDLRGCQSLGTPPPATSRDQKASTPRLSAPQIPMPQMGTLQAGASQAGAPQVGVPRAATPPPNKRRRQQPPLRSFGSFMDNPMNLVQEILMAPAMMEMSHTHELASFMAERLRHMDVRKRKRVENRLLQVLLQEDPA